MTTTQIQSLDQFIGRPLYKIERTGLHRSDALPHELEGLISLLPGASAYVANRDYSVCVGHGQNGALWSPVSEEVSARLIPRSSVEQRVQVGESFNFPVGHSGFVRVKKGSLSVVLSDPLYNNSISSDIFSCRDDSKLVVKHGGNDDSDYLAQHGYRRRVIHDLTDNVKTYQVPNDQKVGPEVLWGFGLGNHYHPENPDKKSNEYPNGTPIHEKYIALSPDGFYWGFEAVEGNKNFMVGTRFAGHVPQYHVLTVPSRMAHVVSPMPGLKFLGITSDSYSKTEAGAVRHPMDWFYPLREELMVQAAVTQR